MGETIINAAGTLYLRDSTLSGTVQYSTNNSTWTTITIWPVTINNTRAGFAEYLKVIATTDIYIKNNLGFIICGSTYIQIGNETLNNNGTRPNIYIENVSGYSGLIRNGTDIGNGNNFIRIINLNVVSTGSSTLGGIDGWIGRMYFARGANNNYIINCSSNGTIPVFCGGIVGQYSSVNNGKLFIIGCNTSGFINDRGGGIVGANSGSSLADGIVVESCYTTGIIASTAGGIIGSNATKIRANNCYSTGNGQVGTNAGGIFGDAAVSCVANSCYSTPPIFNRGGGIFGYTGNLNTAINCYSLGVLSGGTPGGRGIFGANNTNTTTTNCYTANGTWNKSAADAALTGVPVSGRSVGTTWVNVVNNQPYELLNMGHTAFSLTNTTGTALINTYTEDIGQGNSSRTKLVNDTSFSLLDINGSPTNSNFSINSTTGAIQTVSGTTPGTYSIVTRHTGRYIYSYTTVTLNVFLRPEKPENLSSSISATTAGSVTISFTPGNNNGTPITNYEYSINDGVSYTAFSPAITASPAVISGLTGNVSYALRLRAVSIAGQGAQSDSITVIPPTNSISASGILYLRKNGNIYEYSTDTVNWLPFSFPCTIINTSAASNTYLKVRFVSNFTVLSSLYYLICGSSYIQFGNETLDVGGARETITVADATNYPGFIRNGSISSSGYGFIKIVNLQVLASGSSTLVTNGGWIAQSYYSKGAINNYIINCYSNGNITNGGGGIVGEYAGSASGNLHIIGCNTTGIIEVDSGGIAGRYAGDSGTILIEKCSSSGNITNSGSGGGGGIFSYAAGNNSGSASAIYCYSTGVIGINGGGIYGYNAGSNSGAASASVCYSSGNLQLLSGGIFGYGATSTSTATNCFSSGSISSNAGGIFGYNSSGVANNCYSCGEKHTSNTGFIGGIYSASSNDNLRGSNNKSEINSSSSGWNKSNANTALIGAPATNRNIGALWVNIIDGSPYEIFNEGGSPYLLNNILDTSFNSTFSVTTNSEILRTTPANMGSSFSIVEINDLIPSSYRFSINPINGIIYVPTDAPLDTYTIIVRSVINPYTYSTVILTLESNCILQCPNFGKPVSLNNHNVQRQFSRRQSNAMRLRTGLKLR